MALQRGEKQLTALAREHGVEHMTIYRWTTRCRPGGAGRALERTLGCKTLECEILGKRPGGG